MKLKKIISKKIDDARYKAVASVMKKNFIGLAKKYKDEKLLEYVEKLNDAIDKRDREEYYKYLSKVNVRIEFLKAKKV